VASQDRFRLHRHTRHNYPNSAFSESEKHWHSLLVEQVLAPEAVGVPVLGEEPEAALVQRLPLER
jgi:hypothetical protein